MKHFRITLHTDDPEAYAVVEALAKRLTEQMTRGAEGGTPGYGWYIESEQYDDHFSYPITGNGAEHNDAE